ncbi:hypothetical protein [Sinorhizobium meliloti]|uniref:hypothetical protein n=1 Tax=Rhizobium meliloti TaxID=382 RepID=UPI00299D8949
MAEFTVKRQHLGDRMYLPGDTRQAARKRGRASDQERRPAKRKSAEAGKGKS